MYLTTKSYAGVSFIARVLTSISPNYSNLNKNLPKWEKHRIRMKQTVVFINIRRIVVISCSDSSCYSNFENINKIRLKKLDEQQFFFQFDYIPHISTSHISRIDSVIFKKIYRCCPCLPSGNWMIVCSGG